MNERHMDSISPEMFMVLKWGGKSIWQNVLRVFQGPEGLINDLKYFDKWSQLRADLVPKEKSPQGRILWWQPSGTQCQRKMAPQHGTRHWPRQRQRNLGTGTEGWSLNFQSCRRVIGQKCASQERHFWKWKCPGRQDKTSLHPVGGPTALHWTQKGDTLYLHHERESTWLQTLFLVPVLHQFGSIQARETTHWFEQVKSVLQQCL